MGIQRRHQLEAAQQISTTDLTYKLPSIKKAKTEEIITETDKISVKKDLIKTLIASVVIIGGIVILAWKL